MTPLLAVALVGVAGFGCGVMFALTWIADRNHGTIPAKAVDTPRPLRPVR